MTGKMIILALALLLAGLPAGNGREPDTPGYAVRTMLRHQAENLFRDTEESDAPGDDHFLILVNKEYPLPDDYEVELERAFNGACDVSVEIAPALKQMLVDGQKEGLRFVVASGYRDATYQQGLLDEDIGKLTATGMSYEKAYEQVTRDTMPAGHSEHSTGLAVDIVSASYQMLNDGLESTPEIQWLQKHCAEYGFILRFPKGKEEITKIIYESWHFRYVGVEAAREIQERGITLEEYVSERAQKSSGRLLSRAIQEWISRAGEAAKKALPGLTVEDQGKAGTEGEASGNKKPEYLLKTLEDGVEAVIPADPAEHEDAEEETEEKNLPASAQKPAQETERKPVQEPEQTQNRETERRPVRESEQTQSQETERNSVQESEQTQSRETELKPVQESEQIQSRETEKFKSHSQKLERKPTQ